MKKGQLSILSERKIVLPAEEFDHSVGGWREVDYLDGPESAADLIREYIARNKQKLSDESERKGKFVLPVMYFHIGQLLAKSGKGKYADALTELRRSFVDDDECWNAYVLATIGFLEKDTQAVRDALRTIDESTQVDKHSGNRGIVENFLNALENGMYEYQKVYAMPRER